MCLFYMEARKRKIPIDVLQVVQHSLSTDGADMNVSGAQSGAGFLIRQWKCEGWGLRAVPFGNFFFFFFGCKHLVLAGVGCASSSVL